VAQAVHVGRHRVMAAGSNVIAAGAAEGDAVPDSPGAGSLPLHATTPRNAQAPRRRNSRAGCRRRAGPSVVTVTAAETGPPERRSGAVR
jgi:hypothetical protein